MEAAIRIERHKGPHTVSEEINRAFVFCSPKNLYRDMSEEEAAIAYTNFAIKEYDAFIIFGPSYDPLKPDLEMIVGNKESKELKLTVFANQPIKSVGNIHFAHGAGARSTSYLFNPACTLKNRLLPDLDVIECNRESMAKEVKKFYEAAGWKVAIYKGRVESYSDTSPCCVEIANPEALISLAEEKVGYNREKLCFKV